jgi:hypothetical protein
MTFPGSIIPCGDYFFVAYNGVDKFHDNQEDNLNSVQRDVYFMKLDPRTGKVLKRTKFGNRDQFEVNAKAGALGDSCNRFLFGYGQATRDRDAPVAPGQKKGSQHIRDAEKFYLMVIDADGNKKKREWEVSQETMWYLETPWFSLPSGAVGWATTWRRQSNGKPRWMPMADDGTFCHGYNCVSPSRGYGLLKEGDSRYRPRTGTAGFTTNELFVSIYNP